MAKHLFNVQNIRTGKTQQGTFDVTHDPVFAGNASDTLSFHALQYLKLKLVNSWNQQVGWKFWI